MIIEEDRRHHPESDKPTNSEEICLSDNIRTYPRSNHSNHNNTIEETAVVHCQPSNQQIVEADSEDEGSDSSGDEDEDDNKKKWLAHKSPQTTINNQVSDAERTTITNKLKTEYRANKVEVTNNYYYSNSLVQGDNLNRIEAAPTEKNNTIDIESDVNVEPKSSDTSSQPLCKEDKGVKWWTKKRLITISGAVLAGLAIIGILVYFLISDSSNVNIISREEWDAKSQIEPANPLEVIPAKYVIIIHTRTDNCFSKAHCSKSVRELQSYDMSEANKTDISYNWLVGGDGWVYQCRGWDVEGDHTKNYDHKSIGIGFIGTFKTDVPSKDQIAMGKRLIKKGVEEKHISKDYILVGQRQCLPPGSSESPGEKLYKIIKEWEKYSPACF